MNMPGFAAEQSLNPVRGRYRSSRQVAAPGGARSYEIIDVKYR